MSNPYVKEPPTSGKILLKTSCGDIDIELQSKEAPMACRNFVQLCLEGYYDNTTFHRVIKDQIVQGGDPSGTGTGDCRSIFEGGKPFKNEFHQRLNFSHRGIVAMASSGPNTNQSQFFFTLARCDQLNKKHTIFGKVTGNTIFNMIELGNVEILPGSDDCPEHPHRILSAEILLNPFDDIDMNLVQRNRKQIEKERRKLESNEDEGKQKSNLYERRHRQQRKRSLKDDKGDVNVQDSSVNNRALLSFGDVDQEHEDEDFNETFSNKKPMFIKKRFTSAYDNPSYASTHSKKGDENFKKENSDLVEFKDFCDKKNDSNVDVTSTEVSIETIRKKLSKKKKGDSENMSDLKSAEDFKSEDSDYENDELDPKVLNEHRKEYQKVKRQYQKKVRIAERLESKRKLLELQSAGLDNLSDGDDSDSQKDKLSELQKRNLKFKKRGRLTKQHQSQTLQKQKNFSSELSQNIKQYQKKRIDTELNNDEKVSTNILTDTLNQQTQEDVTNNDQIRNASLEFPKRPQDFNLETEYRLDDYTFFDPLQQTNNKQQFNLIFQ